VDSIWFWIGALVVVTLFQPVLKILIALVAGKQIGASALARQPDRITLQRASATAWKNGDARRQAASALEARGFEDVGIYSIPELPGILVQLLAHGGDGVYAAVYEHPQAGSWFDLVTKFQDGTSLTYSTSAPTALKPRPGHASVNMRGAQPAAVLDKMLAMRPQKPNAGASFGMAVSVFETAYAEGVAYRKQVGISTREVVKTATRKAA